ncbi:hypothetical protein EVAR_28881_1 [Eumeta japonica]|uniref:Uncharacterized protein n=1 Tax=Eumeta variegata TaxID=151549 RepID=A0A4C1WY56_EUMVA|nr:hypothetical protein EVAR_28881_1 [Eumeta japonica]
MYHVRFQCEINVKHLFIKLLSEHYYEDVVKGRRPLACVQGPRPARAPLQHGRRTILRELNLTYLELAKEPVGNSQLSMGSWLLPTIVGYRYDENAHDQRLDVLFEASNM